jgi:threonine/homoserine/homoserine lactone efflux protein
MGEAIGQVLSLGVGVAISPVPIIAVVLMLSTPRARSNGPAFLLGWLVGLAVVGTIILLASSGAEASEKGSPATWVSVAKLVLGGLLLLIALRTWHGRPRGDGKEASLPSWMKSIDAFTAAKSFGMGALLSGVNPKNLLLTVSAGAAIAQTGVSAGKQAVALAVFIVIGTLGTGVPVAIYFTLGERAKKLLDGLKDWMGAHNAAIMTVLCVLLAAKQLGDGITGLSA